MKKIVNRKSRLGLVLAGCLLVSGASQASVIVYFSEDAGTVSIDMVGTIAIDSAYSSTGSASLSPALVSMNNGLIISSSTDGLGRIKYADAGVATTTTLAMIPSNLPSFGSKTGGFFGADLYAVGAGVVDAGTRTYDFTGIHFEDSGTLAALGADSFVNQLAWTANSTGDTITYVTGVIPEPSVLALVGVFGLGLVGVRRVFLI